ncbi:WxL domain-containing protein [Listeria ilorinensis]|uniref:WxL domain-containing protein n=1 Tax=Listeria ilorinensis TaxID=2867439 RepID=UPI001EF6FCEA|nr:WxL domain-containing protein [Listeria ilorinensis]
MKSVKITVAAGVALSALLPVSYQVFAEDYSRELQSNAIVEFVPDESGTDPVDPINPDPNNPVNPYDPSTDDHEPEDGTAGPLSIDFASSLDFGKNKISSADQTYYAEAQYYWNDAHNDKDTTNPRPNYIQVSDKRGTNAGWTLNVKQEGQLKNATADNGTLTGAEIKLTNGTAKSSGTATAPVTYDVTLDPSGASSKVMDAKDGVGAGTWVDAFGSISDVEVEGETVKKNTAITLTIPGATPKDAAKYSTKLTWTLTDVPGNDN